MRCHECFVRGQNSKQQGTDFAGSQPLIFTDQKDSKSHGFLQHIKWSKTTKSTNLANVVYHLLGNWIPGV